MRCALWHGMPGERHSVSPPGRQFPFVLSVAQRSRSTHSLPFQGEGQGGGAASDPSSETALPKQRRSRPVGESLSFVSPKESNQGKGDPGPPLCAARKAPVLLKLAGGLCEVAPLRSNRTTVSSSMTPLRSVVDRQIFHFGTSIPPRVGGVQLIDVRVLSTPVELVQFHDSCPHTVELLWNCVDRHLIFRKEPAQILTRNLESFHQCATLAVRL